MRRVMQQLLSLPLLVPRLLDSPIRLSKVTQLILVILDTTLSRSDIGIGRHLGQTNVQLGKLPGNGFKTHMVK